MKLKKCLRQLPIILVSLLVLASAAAVAQKRLMVIGAARPEVKVELSGSVERDKKSISLDENVTVKSGEVMSWIITSSNEGNAPAREYKTTGVIPAGTQLLAGSVSADGSAKVTYSIDNGKSFSAQPTVEEKQPDGSVKRVAAPASMYTQIRYEWADPLNNGASLKAFYKVRLN
jgi:uncharacterized repeat protein (TIGR01451 family)